MSFEDFEAALARKEKLAAEERSWGAGGAAAAPAAAPQAKVEDPSSAKGRALHPTYAYAEPAAAIAAQSRASAREAQASIEALTTKVINPLERPPQMRAWQQR